MEEVELPTKTKIAAWLMIIGGMLGIFSWIPTLLKYGPELWGLIYLPFVIFGIFLLKRKRWAWWICMILFLIIGMLGVLVLFSTEFNEGGFILLFLSLTPLILLFLDRKNFLKIAS